MPEDKELKCEMCEKEFPVSQNIYIANEYNTVMRCPHCGSKFKTKGKLL
jgi:DNA-directed RNA polymerase subunit RPC12/RpoP